MKNRKRGERMNNIVRIIFKIIITLIFISLFTLTTSTTVVEASFWSDMFGQANVFIQEGRNGAESEVGTSDDQTAEIITLLFNTLMSLGSIIAVGIGGALGIKFMTSSAEDKAKVKESMIPYVIGCAVIFGALAIWKISMMVFSQI